MPKYGVISGLCLPAFGLNTVIYSVNLRIPYPSTGKHRPEKTQYLDSFHAVSVVLRLAFILLNQYGHKNIESNVFRTKYVKETYTSLESAF